MLRWMTPYVYSPANTNHVVEVLRSGVKVDGTLYTSGGPLQVSGSTGAWTFVMPSTAADMGALDACAAGGGGGAGGNDPTNASGGGAGGMGHTAFSYPCVINPGDSLTFAVPSGGTGGLKTGTAATAGGNLVVTNNTSAARDAAWLNAPLILLGGGAGANGTAGTAKVGGTGAPVTAISGAIIAAAPAGGSAAGGAGANGVVTAPTALPGILYGSGAGGGGSGAATAGSGGAAAGNVGTPAALNGTQSLPNPFLAAAVGNLAGGGAGSPTRFSTCPPVAAGGANATAATGYGFSGSGGGGNGNGANGGDGYFRLWWTW